MTILFFVSLLSIVSMVAFKAFDLKLGFVSKTMSFFDIKAHAFRVYIEKKIKLYRKIIYLFLFDFVPAYLYEKSVSLKDYLYKKYYESTSNLKGNRKILKSSGSVSSFLQDIKLEKPETLLDSISDVLITEDQIKRDKDLSKETDSIKVDL